jgi:hypothetical protein
LTLGIVGALFAAHGSLLVLGEREIFAHLGRLRLVKLAWSGWRGRRVP